MGRPFAGRTQFPFPVHPQSASLLRSLFTPANSLFAPAGKFLPEFIGFSGCFGQTKKRQSGAFLGFPCIFPCSQGKRTFWSVGLHHPDMQLPELLRRNVRRRAPIIRSSARWFIGNATLQIIFAACNSSRRAAEALIVGYGRNLARARAQFGHDILFS